MKISRLPHELSAGWIHHDISKSNFARYDNRDWRRRCWACDEQFEESDTVTAVGTDDGPKLLHTRCYHLQEQEGSHGR